MEEMGIPAELFQILKDDAAKVLHSIFQSANLENSAVATGLEKVWLFQSQRRAIPKNVQTAIQLHSLHMLKIRHASAVHLCQKKAVIVQLFLCEFILVQFKKKTKTKKTPKENLRKKQASFLSSVFAKFLKRIKNTSDLEQKDEGLPWRSSG